MRTRASHPGDREAGPAPAASATALQRGAARHLWPHFAALGAERPTVFVRGEGCYLWDESGRRHLDALSSLFCVNAGHGRAALAEAAAAQARTLAYATTWGTGHPRAIELAPGRTTARAASPAGSR
jgi:adenosylmethionine-8-amino-7-oxononanoate aminotransferase